MSQIPSLNNIRTGQKVHVRSISKRGRSKFLRLFMLDNEKQLLEKDNHVLQQRHDRNSERLQVIKEEILKTIEKDLNSNLNDDKLFKNAEKAKEWRTCKIDI